MSSPLEEKTPSSQSSNDTPDDFSPKSVWEQTRFLEKHLSLTARFLIAIIPVILLIFVVSALVIQSQRRATFDNQVVKLQNTFTNLTHDQSAFMLNELRNKEKSLANFLIEMASRPLSKKDVDVLKFYSDTVVNNKLITYAGFFSPSNELLADSGLPSVHLKLSKYPITFNDKKVGYLVMGISEEQVRLQKGRAQETSDKQTQVLKEFLYSLQTKNKFIAELIMSGLIGIIALLIAHFFHRFITTPLSQCITLIKGFQDKKYDVPIPYQHKQDEIGEIARTLETFRKTLMELEKLEAERDIKNQALIEATAEAERLAYIDELTNLPNRSCCSMDMLEKFSNATLENNFALIYVDLDDFKKVNDTLGHSAGDCLLAEVSKRLSILINSKTNSSVYRWGGDEFLIFYDRINGPTEQICQAITNTMGIQLKFGSHSLWPSCSMGIAKFPEDGDNFETLMICTDLALHKTKQDGKGYHFFTRELKDKLDHEARLESELQQAVEERELFLVYQPQVDAETLEVTGIEALLRWGHPERGILTPWAFIDTIENTPLAPIVGAYVFDEAFKAARKWLDNGLDFGRLAVNLSPNHLKHGTLIHDLKGSLETYNITTKHVTVEVLESLLLDQSDEKQNGFIAALSQMGVHIELDDFGTGYASLSHITELPINGLKIDRSFTNQILTDERKAIVIQSLMNLTKMLELNLVCEGVETVTQMQKIRSYGACSLQGYLIAKPMTFPDMTNWLKRNENLHFINKTEKSIA